MKMSDAFFDDVRGEVRMEGKKHLDIGELESHHEIVHLVAEEAELGNG